jgi:addiction module HigA family antidote
MTIMHNPAHPGEILREWVGDINQQKIADSLDISRTTVSRILNGHAGITADVDVRLSEALGTSPGFWLALQSQYDLAEAMKAKRKKARPLVHNEAACFA